MNNKTYFLCSQEVINKFPYCEHSEPFKSGYSFENDINYYIAVLDFDKVKCQYNNSEDFWVRECVGGYMGVSKLTLKNIKQYGLLVEIENKLNLTNLNNIAMVIYNLSEKYNCNPIEFINKINN